MCWCIIIKKGADCPFLYVFHKIVKNINNFVFSYRITAYKNRVNIKLILKINYL